MNSGDDGGDPDDEVRVIRDRNPMTKKMTNGGSDIDDEIMVQLSGMELLRSIFKEAVPVHKRQKVVESTDAIMVKSRHNLPEKLPEELVVKRTLLSERQMKGSDFRSDGSLTSRRGSNEYVTQGKKSKENDDDMFSETGMSSPGASLLNIDKKRRFAMSLATLASKSHKRDKIIRENGIYVLKLLSVNPDEVVQRCCSAAFAFLSLEAFARERMVEESAGQAITKLVMSSNQNVVVKHNCSRAMVNMTLELGKEARLVKEGFLADLLNIINFCPEAVDMSLLTLFNMSCVVERFPRIEEVTEVLLRLSVYLTNRAQEALYLTILRNLSAIRGNQLRMVEDGVQRIVEGVFKSPDLHLRTIGATIFSNFCTDMRAKNKLVEHGAIATMVVMLEDESEEIRCFAAKVFYSLAKDPQLRPKIFANEKALLLLLKMGKDAFLDVHYGQSVARSYRSLIKEVTVVHFTKLVKWGIIDSIRHLLEREDNIIRHCCTETLCSLFEIDDCIRDSTVRDEVNMGVEVLINLAVHANYEHIMDGVVLEWAMYSLYHLLHREMLSFGQIQNALLPNIQLLCASTFEKARYFCAAILKLISQNEYVDTAEAIHPMVHMMSSDDNPITQRNCAASLANMIHDSDNCAIMLEAGALPHIVRLSTLDSIATKMKCAAIFSRLSLHEHYFGEFARDDVMKVLVDLCKVDHLITQRWVVMALSNLSHQPSLCNLLYQVFPVPHIISMAGKRDETLRRGCAAVICNLAAILNSEKRLIAAGVISSLLVTAMIASDQTIAKIICIKAITNLMSDISGLKALAKEGVIWCLSSLILVKDVELSLLCVRALAVFAKDHSRDLLSSPASIKAVLWAINCGPHELEMQRLSARVLALMLRHSTDADHVFRKQAVDSLFNNGSTISLVHSNDPEIRELCVLSLFYASQSEACRSLIASSGVLILVGSDHMMGHALISFVYITAIDNVACGIEGFGGFERVELFRQHPQLIINRFLQTVTLNDEQLLQRTSKAIYSLSCSHDNVHLMAYHDVLPLLKALWQQRYPDLQDDTVLSAISVHSDHPTNQYLLATMYNLSTYPATQAKFVSDGFIELLVTMFQVAQTDKNLCPLACYAAFHMACGSTSSSRLVESGCAKILCCIHDPNDTSFSLDLQMRCAMSIRNLICVVANQQALVDAGCIKALVYLADKASEALGTRTPVTNKGISFKEVNKVNISPEELARQKEANIQMGIAVRKNAAAALRCLTFNRHLRNDLEPAGALLVLLEDLTREMDEHEERFDIDYTLLSELEAESWQNGSRGRQQEGRAPFIASAPLNLEYLESNTNTNHPPKSVEQDGHYLSADNVVVQDTMLEKYIVQIELEDRLVGESNRSLDSSYGSSANNSAQSSSNSQGTVTEAPDPLEEMFLEDTLMSLTKFRHEDGGSKTSEQILLRRPCQALAIQDAINPISKEQLTILSDVLDGTSSGPSTMRSVGTPKSPKSANARNPTSGSSDGFSENDEIIFGGDGNRGSERIAAWNPVIPSGVQRFGQQHDNNDNDDNNRAISPFSPDGSSHGSSRATTTTPNGKRVFFPTPIVTNAPLPELKSSTSNMAPTLRTTSQTGRRNSSFDSLPPLTDSNSIGSSIQSPSLHSSSTATSTSKKSHFNRKEKKFNELCELINSTQKAKKWDSETVLEQYKKIQSL